MGLQRVGLEWVTFSFTFTKGFMKLVVQSLRYVWPFVTPWTSACHASLSFIIHGVGSNSCPLKQWCHQTISSSVVLFCSVVNLLIERLSSIFPSMRVFSNELALHVRWPKYWSFSFSISHSNEYSGLISFRIDWFDLLTVQGTFKSLL